METVPAFGFGIRPLGAEHAAQAADNAHHVRRGDNHVKLKKFSFWMRSIRSSRLRYRRRRHGSLVRLGALGENSDAHVLAGAVRRPIAPHLLVGMAGVNAQLDVQLDGFVELGLCGRNNGGSASDGSYRRVRSIVFALSTYFLPLCTINPP